MLPVVETSTKRKPMIGPVQENDTSDRVNAIRKMLNKPPAFSALTVNCRTPGRRQSDFKSTKERGSKHNQHQEEEDVEGLHFVESEFSALAPNISVIAKPKLHRSQQWMRHRSMHRGYFFLSLVRFRKKLTVIGIMGHTHGVNKAIRPPTNPAKKIYSRNCLKTRYDYRIHSVP